MQENNSTPTDEMADRRSKVLHNKKFKGGRIIYWMSRDQRVNDNWALHYAIEAANRYDVPLGVVFCQITDHLVATERKYAFMMGGLRQIESKLRRRGIGFHLVEGQPDVELPSFLHEVGAGMVVTDFYPLKIEREWKRRVIRTLDIPVTEVDAHNIVPCRIVAKRRVMSFDSFRAKVMPRLPEFLTEYPTPIYPNQKWDLDFPTTDWNSVMTRFQVDHDVKPLTWLLPGEEAAKDALVAFCRDRLFRYPEGVIDPTKNMQSDLSPYIHFGNLSSQRVVLQVQATDAPEKAKSMFIERVVVYKEIADNFCLHTEDYDSVGAFPAWARRSINMHRSDVREHLYTLDELDGGQTHDPLWNATQMELVKRGKIHGYLREYWANKIMEWTRSPEEAFSFAIYLNDRYSLDGRDPRGYTGIANVIGGLYSHPYRSKDVLGKVKEFTYTEARFRFDTHAYQVKVKNL